MSIPPSNLRRNTDRSFVGIAELKRKQAEYLARFESRAAKGEWQEIHRDHFDWWMFPIDETSQYGAAYTVYEDDIAELRQDAVYVRNYLRGVEVLALVWGWNLAERSYISHPQHGQTWSDWPIRLYKAARSLQLFGYIDEFESLKIFALDLLRRGVSLHYNNQDLAVLFTHGRPRRR